MKINNKIKTVSFLSLNVGDTFEFDNIIFFKISPVLIGPNHFNAIRFPSDDSTNVFSLITSESEVIPVNCELNVNYN